MKKYIFFLMGAVCFLLSSSAVHANELNKSDANIIGHVLDKNTEEHLSFISVSLKGTTIGTMTDASGHYFLKNLPEGEFTMEVSAVGQPESNFKKRENFGGELRDRRGFDSIGRSGGVCQS